MMGFVGANGRTSENETGVNTEAKLMAFYCQPEAPLHMNYSFSVQNVQRKQAHDSHPRLLDEENISYMRQTNPCPLTPSTVPLLCPGGGKHVSSIKQHALKHLQSRIALKKTTLLGLWSDASNKRNEL